MAPSSPSRQWAQLANCVHVVTCGVCGTSSSALQDAALAEPLLRNPGQHPAASAEAPSPSVLTAARQQPALPARTSSQPSPKVATAAGSSFDTPPGSNDASGAHANPAPAQAHTPNLALPAEQKSKGSPDRSGLGATDSAVQVPAFPKLDSPQPTQAHDVKNQAPHGAKQIQSAGTDHSHYEHAPLAATGQQPASKASKRSAEPPAIAVESSKPSTDQAKAAADKKPSAASSVAAAASPDSESRSQPEATTATQAGAASQQRHGGAAAPESLPNSAAAKAVHSQAQVKSSAKEVSPPGSAATQQSPVRPPSEKAPAVDGRSAAKGVAAKHSLVRSVAKDESAAATGTAAKLSPVKSSADGTSAADKQSAATGASAKQSPLRLSAADKSSPAEDTAAKQGPVGPPVVEASEADQRSAAAGTAAKKASAAGTAAKADSATGEGSLASGPAAKHSKGGTPSAANSGPEAVSRSLGKVAQSTSQPKQGQQSSADGANAVAAHESPSAKGAPTETVSSHVQGTKGKDQSAGRMIDEQEEANKAHLQKGDKAAGDAKRPSAEPHEICAAGDAVHSAEDAVPSIASAKESQREGGSVGEGRPDSSTIEPQVQEKLGAPQEPSKSVVANTASSTSQHEYAHATTLSEPEQKLTQTKEVKSPPSKQQKGDASSCAANGHDKDVSNSLSLSAQPGTASTPVKGTSSKGGNEFVASGLGGAHGASPDQEAARNAKGQHAATKQEDSAGDGPGAAGTNKESDTAKTAGRKTEGGDADSGHDGAAQMTETGTARKDTAAADAGAGKKKNKSKKKKKGK